MTTVAVFRGCTKSAGGTFGDDSNWTPAIHAGVVAELIVEGTGGTALTKVRSTLTGDVWSVNPNLIVLLDLDDAANYDVMADLAYNCDCPEVN